MQMIGCAGTTLRSVIEHHQRRIFPNQLSHDMIGFADGLRLMISGGDGVMLIKDRIRIHQYFEVLSERQHHLLLGTILSTEEAGSFRQCFFVNIRASRQHARGIDLHLHLHVVNHQLVVADLIQFSIPSADIRPYAELLVEE